MINGNLKFGRPGTAELTEATSLSLSSVLAFAIFAIWSNWVSVTLARRGGELCNDRRASLEGGALVCAVQAGHAGRRSEGEGKLDGLDWVDRVGGLDEREGVDVDDDDDDTINGDDRRIASRSGYAIFVVVSRVEGWGGREPDVSS